MTRYFDEVRTVLERHGGTVEKFIGDAVMAVFGIPQVHEDDALRAVRAARGPRRRGGTRGSDFLEIRGDALVDLAEVLRLADRRDEAADASVRPWSCTRERGTSSRRIGPGPCSPI